MTPLFGFLPTIGPMELTIVGIVGVLLFGKRVPEVARSLGKSIIEFKKGFRGIEDEVDNAKREVYDASREIGAPPAPIPPDPTDPKDPEE